MYWTNCIDGGRSKITHPGIETLNPGGSKPESTFLLSKLSKKENTAFELVVEAEMKSFSAVSSTRVSDSCQ